MIKHTHKSRCRASNQTVFSVSLTRTEVVAIALSIVAVAALSMLIFYWWQKKKSKVVYANMLEPNKNFQV